MVRAGRQVFLIPDPSLLLHSGTYEKNCIWYLLGESYDQNSRLGKNLSGYVNIKYLIELLDISHKTYHETQITRLF